MFSLCSLRICYASVRYDMGGNISGGDCSHFYIAEIIANLYFVCITKGNRRFGYTKWSGIVNGGVVWCVIDDKNSYSSVV